MNVGSTSVVRVPALQAGVLSLDAIGMWGDSQLDGWMAVGTTNIALCFQ
jgi:hypothetical protein